MSKREQGDGLEDYLIKLLRSVGIDAHKTAGSGAVRGDGDVVSKEFAFECKTQYIEGGKSVVSPRIDINEFDKIEHEALRIGKEPVLVLENGQRRRFAVMDLDQFIQIVAKMEQRNG